MSVFFEALTFFFWGAERRNGKQNNYCLNREKSNELVTVSVHVRLQNGTEQA